MSTDIKASNPKEQFASLKVDLELVPDTAVNEMAMAFLEGALKYGQYNWRIAGVKASTYVAAARRHLSKYWNGQDRDPDTLVRELASVMACCAIIIDAEICGRLNDNRPPRAPVGPQLNRLGVLKAHLKELFKSHSPPQYTHLEYEAIGDPPF